MVTAETEATVIRIMSTLNRAACQVMRHIGVHAATDVTGYGLLGHLRNILVASRVGAVIRLSDVPVLDEAWELVKQRIVPGGTVNNLKFLTDHVTWDQAVTEEARLILCDAQTSGGLLIAVEKQKAGDLVDGLQKAGTPAAAVIGELVEDADSRIAVTR
jgi:selenide,water dikinase